MMTYNYEIELMMPMQVNKDILFNEAITKLDGFCNIAIDSFELEIPKELKFGTLHIIKEGEYKNYICYCFTSSSSWRLQKPNRSMIFYIKSEKKFFIFDDEAWVKIEGF